MRSKSISWLILLLITGITVWLGYQVTLSRFDYDFEKFFPKGNEDTRFFEQFRDQFENDYDFLLIGIEHKQGVFQPDFLQKIETLTDSLEKLDNVRNVYSPTRLRLPVVQGLGVASKKVVRLDTRENLIKDSIHIFETREFIGSFFSEDGKSLCLVLETEEQMAKVPSDVLLFDIESLTGSYGFDKVHLAGKIKAQYVYLTRMQKEIVFFLSIALVLVVILLGVTFRSLWNIIFPILVILFSIVWQLGIMHLVGKDIDILTTLLPTILFVVGMSDVVHILNKYLEELRSGKTKKQAIRVTVKEIGWATFLTSVTTALGFFSLFTSNIIPIREFGMYTSLGVMIAFLLAFTLLPAFLLLLPPPKVAFRTKNRMRWNNMLAGWMRISLRNPKLIIAISCGVLIISLIGISQLKVNNLLLEDLRPHEPLKKEFAWFENHYSGGRPFEMLISVEDSSKTIFSYEVMQEIQKIEYAVQEYFQAGFLQSPAAQLRFFNRAIHSGKNQYFTIPEDRNEYEKLVTEIKKYGLLEQKEIKRFITDDLRTARISGKMEDVGSYKVNKMEKQFLAYTSREIDHQTVSYQLTGSARLIDKNISYLSVSLIKGLALAFLIIAILFGILFKSLRMIFIALIPNILPLIIIGGLMGFFGVDLKVSTSIIFTIAFGIAVDDTIHFLSRYRLEIRSGKTNLYAIKRSYLGTGKALIITSIILCAGFVSMILSSFLSIFYIGVLVSGTLFLALLADLFLLPVLLVYVKKNK